MECLALFTATPWCKSRQKVFSKQVPYHLALVRLEDGSLITAQLTDVVAEVEIGSGVEMVTRKLTTDGQRGMIVYGYKFRPLIK